MNKSRKKPKGVIQENRNVYFNLADPEQKLDYDFTYTINFSREVRDYIRAIRCGLQTMVLPPAQAEDVMRFPDYTEDDALNSLL